MTLDRRDHYRLLHVQADAPTEVIRGAYRALIGQHHPDMGGDHATALRLNEAYAVLTDDQRRARYDATRHARADRRNVVRTGSADWAQLFVAGAAAPVDVRLRDRSSRGYGVYSGRPLAPACHVRLVGRSFDSVGTVVRCLRFGRVYTVHVQLLAVPHPSSVAVAGRTPG